MSQNTQPKAVKDNTSQYNDLKFYFGYLNTLFSIRFMLAVDMVTVMPSGGLKKRLNDISSITKRIYAETTSDSITRLLDDVEADTVKNPENWTSWDLANVQEMRRIYSHLKALPPSLYINIVRINNEGRQHHQKALKENKSWSDVEPYIQHVVDLYKQAAEKKQAVFKTDTLYDALLKGYAPDLKESYIDDLYARTLPELKSLREQKIKKQNGEADIPFPSDEFKRRDLIEFNHKLLKKLGFTFERGSLSITNVSPMSGGSKDDARVLIRCPENSHFTLSMEDTLYQGAKGLYIQGLSDEWHEQPVGREQGAVIITAISLLYKVILGRRREFFEFVKSVGSDTLPGFADNYDPEIYFKLKHTIRNTPQRNDADAMSKILHDILRYRIERDLINGKLNVADIPERWNQESKELLGIEPKNLKDGALQNPDWFTGRFGFIPSNTVSYIIAAQMYKQIKKEHPDLLNNIQNGDFSDVKSWLTDNIFKHGRSIDSLDLIKESTKKELNEKPIIELFQSHYLNGE